MHPDRPSTFDEDLGRAIKRVKDAGRELESRGERVGTYVAKINKSVVETQRYTSLMANKYLKVSVYD